MGLFWDFPEIGALTADPKQDQSYDFLKTCLNNEVAHGAEVGRWRGGNRVEMCTAKYQEAGRPSDQIYL